MCGVHLRKSVWRECLPPLWLNVGRVPVDCNLIRGFFLGTLVSSQIKIEKRRRRLSRGEFCFQGGCWLWLCGSEWLCFVSVTFQNPPVHGFDVVRHSEPGVSSMKTTAFMSSRDEEGEEEEKTEKPVKQRRETSLRRKVAKPPIQSLPTTSVPFKR